MQKRLTKHGIQVGGRHKGIVFVMPDDIIKAGASFLSVGKSKLNALLAGGVISRVKLERRTLLSLQELRDFANNQFEAQRTA